MNGVYRGGTVLQASDRVRLSRRNGNSSQAHDYIHGYIGFRLVCEWCREGSILEFI